MNKQAKVYNNEIPCGILEKANGHYTFTYFDEYIKNPSTVSISLTLPKEQKEFQSKTLFSFFFGLLAEGILKEQQCRNLKIDPEDHFTRLIKTAGGDTIGSVTVEEIK